MLIAAVLACAPSAPARALELTPSLAAPASPVEAPDIGVPVQTPAGALAQDASEYAHQYGVSLADATQRLLAQQESVSIIDRLQAEHRGRLAGIFIEHEPAYRFVILLTGTEPVADEEIVAGGISVPVVFRIGAPATRDQILAAIGTHQAEIRAALSHPPGMGVDPRSATLVIMMRARDVGAEGPAGLGRRLAKIAGVPVTIRPWTDADMNLSVVGGSRVVGFEHSEGRRYVCTTGFVVTDGLRTGVTTAAHCPDTLTYVDRDKGTALLSMVGAWGARYQDVQIHVSGELLQPLFNADADMGVARPLTSWRNRTSTRAGDFVCHRGERTGYSCAEVEFVDFSPPGDLCAGPCEPLWVAVRGPSCKRGDSGGPVFSGTIAFGTMKGASYASDGTCRLYYYMSTDYLPPGWTLLHQSTGQQMSTSSRR